MDTSEVSIKIADGIVMDLWAPSTLLAGPVAISVDNNGVVFVSETDRRKSSDIDIRQHREWMTEDLALQTIEQTADFHKRKLDPKLSDQNTWMTDFNGDGVRDWRDLEVETERIRRIWDEDKDGRADASNIFAQGFNDMLTGVAAGVLKFGDNVFLTAAPDVFRLSDIDNDGDADTKEVISHGYGIHIAYAGHDMSGLTMGPDGKIYWSIGDIGVNTVDKEGKRWAYPNQGAVMRCNPDGSDFEVYAHGLRNPQELAFDAYGNLISVDNDGDNAGERERFVHIIEGSDTGWRINWQFGKYRLLHEAYKVWMDEKLYLPYFPGQAAYITPALGLAPDGPAGFAFNPGTALGEKWENHFFGSYFKGSDARSLIHTFKLKPEGASFDVVDEQVLIQGISSTGLSFAPDGGLYIADWLNGYNVKDVGRVWRLDVPKDEHHPLRERTQNLLANGMGSLSEKELLELLAYPDMRIRMEAQFELVKRKDTETLLEGIAQKGNIFARLHGVWGIGQLARNDKEHAAVLTAYLSDETSEVRAQVAKVMGDATYEGASSQLLEQLNDEDRRAAYFAAEALGKIKEKKAFEPLVELLASTEEKETHFRHAAILALSRLGDETNLSSLSEHPDRKVRIAAVVALRKITSPKLAVFLQDSDPLVVVEAARAIHDDFSVLEALEDLAKAITRTEIQNEAFLRRAINANLRLGDSQSAQRLANFVNESFVREKMREEAIWSLGHWADPPDLDRVEGRYRKAKNLNPEIALGALAPLFPNLLLKEGPFIKASSAEVAGKLGYMDGTPLLRQLFEDTREKSAVRCAALAALNSLDSKNVLPFLEKALASKDVELRKTAQSILGSLDLSPGKRVEMLATALEGASVSEQQKIFASLGEINDSSAEKVLRKWFEKRVKGDMHMGAYLDLEMAIENGPHETLKADLKHFFQIQKDQNNIFISSLEGGDFQKGRMLVYTHSSAQCVRCHVVNGMGGNVGPDLTHIASELDHRELLASLIDPSERIAPGYGTLVLTQENGEKLVGTVLKEDRTNIILTLASGEDKVIRKTDIQERIKTPSAMPSMQTILTRSEIRDIMAFLVRLK